MKTSKLRVLGLAIFPAVVIAGLALLRLTPNSHAPVDVQPNALSDATPHKTETATPSLPSSTKSTTVATTNSVSATTPAQLWSAPGETTGEKLDPKSASYAQAQREGVKLKGRSSPFNPSSLTPLVALQCGDNVVIPLLGGEQVNGKVNLVQQEADGWVRVGGELTGARSGSFSLGSSGKNVGGTIILPEEQIAYAITEQPNGNVVMQEKPLSDVICFPIPRPKNEPTITLKGLGPQESPPILSSRPGATAVLYLDFDGEIVTDPSWNSGNTIVAQQTSLSSAQITEVWNRVKEDYWPFNIDITTDVSRYNNAPVGHRMRCIITPTCAWYNSCGAGGVAVLNSFDKAGTLFSSTIPCWVFNSSVVGVAEAVSHELGHTLGLHHDGRTSPAEPYYAGHGTGAVGWAPIMGTGYDKELVQWSKGEYANANNQEDDLAIIANAANGFGYVADDAGNSVGSATALNTPGGEVNQTGIISGNNDVDFYVFTAAAPSVVSINANPASISPDLDILLELRSSAGTVLVSSNPDTELNAAVSYNVAAGTYYIKVQGTGRGAVLGDGYSSYGSIGYYSLSGSIVITTVLPWGNNGYGQTIVPVTARGGVTAIAAGFYHTVALKNDGTVVAWGYNGSGQTTVPASLNGVTAIAAGLNYTVALKSNGTVVAWGINSSGETTVPAGLNGVTAIAAGYGHTVALKNDGTVVAWGYNGSGQTNVPAGLNGVTAIAAGSRHSVAVKGDGTVVVWGSNSDGQKTVPADLSGVTAVAAGYGHTVALKNDGTVTAWGLNAAGQTNVPIGLSGVMAIAAGDAHSVALKRDGTVVAWGSNSGGQTNVPAGLNGVTAIAAGGIHTVVLVGLVAYYPFNGNANDASGNGNNGVLHGTDWKYSADRFGNPNSLLLNTTSNPTATSDGTYVAVPRSALLDFNSDFTLAVWVSFRSGLIYYVHNLISNGPDTNSANLRIVSHTDSQGLDYLQFIGNHQTGEIHTLAPHLNDQWFHFVAVRSGNKVSLFRNGGLLADSGISATFATSPEIWLGRHICPGYPTTCPGSYPLLGGLDDVRLYNRALSPNEVLQLYKVEAPIPLQLKIIRQGSNVQLSWPVVYTNFNLLGSTALTGSAWITNTSPQTITGNNIFVTLPATNSRMFYRLKAGQ